MKALPTEPAPLPMIRPRAVPLAISSSRMRQTPRPSPKGRTPASMATPMATEVSMVSMPMSSINLSAMAIWSRLSTQQSAPIAQIDSYSKPEVSFLPAASL